MSYEVQGDIHSIDETREYGQNGFTKREFVIKLTGERENPQYPNYVALEFIRDRCALLDAYQVGDSVKVSFDLTGRLWNPPGDKPERCFVSLQAWRIEKLGASANDNMDQTPPAEMEEYFNQSADFDDDVPF